MEAERYIEPLKTYITKECGQMTREPEGVLRHPYIVPSTPDSPFYSKTLWDWDSWLTSIVLAQLEIDRGEPGEWLPYERGCALNFLDLCSEDGVMPICLTAKGPARFDRPQSGPYAVNMHKPVLAQHIASLCMRDGGRTDWIQSRFGKLEAFLNRYLESHTQRETGLAYWQDDLAVGVDNDPSVFYRPDGSCGSIYLNSLLYRELLAYGYLLEQAGDVRKANVWRGRAQSLREHIDRYCWDERDGAYYSVDFALRPVDPADWLHSGAPRDYPCLLQRVDSWSSFMPLWAGIADAGKAARIAARARDERTFSCRGGIRSLSRLEKAYDLRASNNPSNWRGPVWGISNFMVFSGLLRYGYEEDARALALKTVALFGADLERNGCLHEYYDPDTCEPIVTHGFMNWNFLVLNMIAWLEGRRFADTF